MDEDDNETGYLDKASCHDGDGLLHRAFSLFVFDPDGRLLMQRRSAAKRLWPLYWSNSCCSHPRAGETMTEATARRLREELNVGAELEFAYKFTYHASYGEQGSEHELCWVYLGRTGDPIEPNWNEIAETRLVTAAELEEELAFRPQEYTPWFVLEWSRLRNEHASMLEAFLAGG